MKSSRQITEQWIPVSEAAAILGCSKELVRHLDRTNRLNAVRLSNNVRLFNRKSVLLLKKVRTDNPPRPGRPKKLCLREDRAIDVRR